MITMSNGNICYYSNSDNHHGNNIQTIVGNIRTGDISNDLTD